ncbi:MAG: exopolysaccharide biosynthesis polyprenyl glycosylphosphotransferase [Armatimonadetes bacterium]|nr:exopolysaccharide biosynthesis polyprenyl glycosylphosphotransferase [Anaerolineae bacterium]
MLFSPNPQRRRLQLRISERRLLLMLGDTLAICVAVLAALAIWAQRSEGDSFDLAFVFSQSYWFFLLTFLWLLLASANDFYDLRYAARGSAMRNLGRLLSITAQILVVYLVVFFFSPREALPRLFILYYGVLSFALIAIWRLLNPALFGFATAPRSLLIVGGGATATEMLTALHEQAAYTVRGVIGTSEEVGQTILGVPIIGTGGDLMNFVRRDRISEIVLTNTGALDGDAFQGVMDAYEYGVAIVPMPLLYERLTGRVPVEHMRDNWAVVLPIEGESAFSAYPALKRLLELVLALVGLLVWLLLLPLIALAIRLDSPGDIFYTQTRVGLNGRIFRVYKFRSMRQNAEVVTGAVFSARGDPRITRVGLFMRKVRLDETPQLINIVRGEMSLIGPRPERPEHVQRLTQKIPFFRTRHVIRPGLTGWAQVRYDYGATDEDALVKLQYDLYYIRHQSLLLDLNILVRTIGRVLRMSGV